MKALKDNFELEALTLRGMAGVAVAFAALLMYDPRLAATRQGFGPAIGLVVGLAALGLGYVFHGRF